MPARLTIQRKIPLLISLSSIIIALRPIIDLQGHYQDGSLNLGGVIGIFVAIIILLQCLFSCKRLSKSWSFVPVLLSFLYLAFIQVANILFAEVEIANYIVTSIRFIVGFSPALVIPLFEQKNQSLERKAIIFCQLLLISSIIPVIIAWLQFFGLYEFTYFDYLSGQEIGRPSGGYWQPNSLGRLMIFDVIVVYLIVIRGYFAPINGRIITIIAFLTTFISTHRTSLLILVILVFLLEVYISPTTLHILKKSLFKTRNLLIYFVMFFTTFLGLIFMSKSAIEGINKPLMLILGAVGNMTNPGEETFLRGRGYKWELALIFIKKMSALSYIFGVGYEPFEPHNDILRIFITTGLTGLFAYTVLFVFAFIHIWLRVNSTGKFCLLLLYFYICLYGLGLQPTSYPFFMWLFFTIHALILIFFKKENYMPTITTPS